MILYEGVCLVDGDSTFFSFCQIYDLFFEVRICDVRLVEISAQRWLTLAPLQICKETSFSSNRLVTFEVGAAVALCRHISLELEVVRHLNRNLTHDFRDVGSLRLLTHGKELGDSQKITAGLGIEIHLLRFKL